MWRDAGSIEAWVAQEEVRLRAVAGKVKTAQEEQGREHWWEVDVGALDEAELPEFATALDVLMADILRRINELAKAPKPQRQQLWHFAAHIRSLTPSGYSIGCLIRPSFGGLG